MTDPRTPPRLPRWLLRTLLPAGDRRDTIEGDLLEEFRSREHAAAWWYWREALSIVIRMRWRRRTKGRSMYLDNLQQDVRYAIRSYAKAPSFTAIVLATLAIGIGASTAIFSIVNGLLLRPLPFPEPERLLWINEANAKGGLMSVSWPNYRDWEARAHSFEALAATRNNSFTMTGGEHAERLIGRRVTWGFFKAIGASPALGRAFVAADDAAGAEPVVIVSHGFWANRFQSDPAAIGRRIVLDGRGFTIVGVMPAAFRFLRDCDLFVAMGAFMDERPLKQRGDHSGYYVLARPKPGIPIEAATSELQQIAAALEREHPDTNSGVHIVAERLGDRIVSDLRQTLLVLSGAVGLLLLIACVNVANLLVARGAAREHELAIRAALGGGRLRLATQMLVESTLLSAAGGALGVLLAFWLLRALVAAAPEDTPRIDEVTLDTIALLFAAGAAMLAGIVFGSLPALHASSVAGQHVVVRGRPAGASAQSHRLRRGLIVVEVALALILLTGATLMLRTLQRMTAVDTGFTPERLVTMELSLRGDRWDDERRDAFVNDVLTRVRALPGVDGAAAVLSLPVDGSNWNSVFIADGVPLPARREDLPSAAITPASPDYFRTMGIAIVRGRTFSEADNTAKAAPVVVINETMARRLWPGQNPVGKRFKQGWPETPSPWREIVGIVRDIKVFGLTEPTPMQVYMPFGQDAPRDFPIVVRGSGDMAGLATSVQKTIHAVDADVPIYAVRPMSDIIGSSMARERIAGLVLTVFAIVALTLAAVGLYGLVAQGVIERRHEIGVRIALGATARQVVRLVVAGGLSMAAVGAAIGIGGALVMTRSLEGLLFGVAPRDPSTLALVVIALLVVAAAACGIPALRATRVAPSEALRGLN